MVNITWYSSFFFWLNRFSPEFTLDREPPSGPHTGRGSGKAGAMPGNLQGSGTSGAPEELRWGRRPRIHTDPLQPNGPTSLFPTLTLTKTHTWCLWIWVLFWPRTMSIRRQYPQDGPDSGSPSGTCRQKDLGFPGAAGLRFGNTAVLSLPCTSSWLHTGPVDSWADRSQDPSQKHGLWALRPCGLGITS